MTNQLVPLTDLPDEKLGQLIAQSGYFQDAKQAGQAVVKVIAGREIGIGPIASMTGIYIVQGRVAFGANVMAAALKRTGRYTYRVTELTDNRCTIDFFEIVGGNREPIGASTFTKEDAAKAGTKNMDKFPKNMLFARAMSNGVKWYAPDVFAGAPIYTPEELGANVNEDGDVIEAEVVVEQSAKYGQPDNVPADAITERHDEVPKPPKPTQNGHKDPPVRPYEPATLRAGMIYKITNAYAGKDATAKQRQLCVMLLAECFAGDHAEANRKTFQKWMFGADSFSELTGPHVLALLDWLAVSQDSGGAYRPSEMAVREALKVNGQALIDAGQIALPEAA